MRGRQKKQNGETGKKESRKEEKKAKKNGGNTFIIRRLKNVS